MTDSAHLLVGEIDVGAGESASPEPWLELEGSRYLLDWLAEQQVSLAISTYQTGKLFFVASGV